MRYILRWRNRMKKQIVTIVLSLFLLIFFACDLQMPTHIEIRKTQELEFRNVDHDLTQYITEMLSMADAGRIGDTDIYILNITPQPREETRLIYTSFNFDFTKDLDLGIDLDNFDIDGLLNNKIDDFLGANFDANLSNQLDALIGAELNRLAVELKKLEDSIDSLRTTRPDIYDTISEYFEPLPLTFTQFINIPPVAVTALGLVDFNPSEFANLFNFGPSDFDTEAFGFNFDDFSFNDFNGFDVSYEVNLNEIDGLELSELTGEIDELFDNIPSGLGIDFTANLYISGSVFPALLLEVKYSNTDNFNPFTPTQINVNLPSNSYNGTGLPPGGILQTPINLEALRTLNDLPLFKFSLDENELKLDPNITDIFNNLSPDEIFPPETPIHSTTIRNTVMTSITNAIRAKIKEVLETEINKLINKVKTMLAGNVKVEAAAWLPVKLTVAAQTQISISEFVDMNNIYTNGDLFGRSTVPSNDSFLTYIRDIEVEVIVSGNPLTGARLVIDDSANSGVEISIDLGSSITIPLSAEHVERINESKFAPQIMIVFDSDGDITIPSNFSLDSFKFKAAVGFALEL